MFKPVSKNNSQSLNGKREQKEVNQNDSIPFSLLVKGEEPTKKVKFNESPVASGSVLDLSDNQDSSSQFPVLSNKCISQGKPRNDYNTYPMFATPLMTAQESSDHELPDVLVLSDEELMMKKKRKHSDFMIFSRKDSEDLSHHHINDLRQEIKQLLSKKSAKLISNTCILETNTPFTVQCAFHHTFETTYEQLRRLNRKFGGHFDLESDQEEEQQQQQEYDCDDSDENMNSGMETEEDLNSCKYVKSCPNFCKQCFSKLEQAQIYARQNKGKLVSDVFQQNLKFKCQRNHVFSLGYKDYHRRWCVQCKKILKKEFKDYLKKEEEKQQREYELKQEELYREARQQYKNSFHQQEEEEQQQKEQESQKIIDAAHVVEQQLEKIAQGKVEDYFEENPELISEISVEQAKEVYKINLFPEQILSCYFENLSKKELIKVFRGYARHIHPDKNNHPDSAKAFQKLNLHYHKALDKLKK